MNDEYMENFDEHVEIVNKRLKCKMQDNLTNRDMVIAKIFYTFGRGDEIINKILKEQSLQEKKQ